jgi:hypothetical protein
MLTPNSLGEETMQELVRTYQVTWLSFIPGFIDPVTVQELLRATRAIPTRMVTSSKETPPGGRVIHWPNHDFGEIHPVYKFFGQPALIEMAKRLTGRASIAKTKRLCWATACGKGQEVGPHRDSTGLIHLAIGLQSTDGPKYGGELAVVMEDKAEERVFLEPGDAVWFDAKRLLHYTTPLIPSERNPDPVRVVILGRYYES